MPYKIDSQLSENQIESDVSSYLGYITPIWSNRFRLVSVNEQITGADKLFNRFVPIYLQFKVSHGLNPGGLILSRFKNKPLTNIISYRASNNLSGNPILYFQLRSMAKTATEYQHNILMKLHKPPLQYGLYIAPLTLEIAEYEKILNGDWLMKFYRSNPFPYKDFEIHDTTQAKNHIMGLNPFLRHHISIPPHVAVTTHEHHYSYSKSGGDVAWHSGELLNDDFRLSNQILRIFNYSYSRDGLGFNRDQFIDFIQQFNIENNVMNYTSTDFDNDNNQNFTIEEFARNLKSKYNISLMFLTQT